MLLSYLVCRHSPLVHTENVVPHEVTCHYTLCGLQWAQVDDKAWRVSNCRMVKYVNFHPRTDQEPLANVYGLHTFTRNFLLRARTQLRPTEDMILTFQVFSSDGFQMDVHEVGEVSSLETSSSQHRLPFLRTALPRLLNSIAIIGCHP